MSDKVSVYWPKFVTVSAVMVTSQNLDYVEDWSGGSIKGTALPPQDRVIDVCDKMGNETRAAVGDYVVREARGHVAYTAAEFHIMYQEVQK